MRQHAAQQRAALLQPDQQATFATITGLLTNMLAPCKLLPHYLPAATILPACCPHPGCDC